MCCFLFSYILSPYTGIFFPSYTVMNLSKYIFFSIYFQVTVCPTVTTVTSFGLYYQGVNWGVAYTLPNRSSVEEYVLSRHVKRRREKRELYSRMETIMNE